MIKEMNKMNNRIVKYDILLNLFMTLIIFFIFKFAIAVIFSMGYIVSLANYLLLRYFIINNQNKILVIITSFMRILIIASLIVPFASSLKLVVSYLIGFMMHYIVLIYCGITQKGSA